VKRPAVLHRALVTGVRTFNRNPWTSERLELVPRDQDSFFAYRDSDPFFEDGLWTNHGHSFLDDDHFQTAYERAVTAGGFDYKIRWRTHSVLWAASTAARVAGAFVECGTGRGFMASAICDYLAWDDRPFYLYDTFEPTLDHGPAPNAAYATSVEDVRTNFAQWPGVRLVVGELPETLAETPEQVAFLHVDLNQATPEVAAVRHFWPRMSPGAVLVYDDYGWSEFDASRRAADEVSQELGFSIFSSPTGQGIAIKN
jgi:hypothetical protein